MKLWELRAAVAPRLDDARESLWEKAIDADIGDNGVGPNADCFACGHFRWSTEACLLLAKTPQRLSVLQGIVDYRASNDPHAQCRSFTITGPLELERRRALCSEKRR